jgi:drug/metabolite transporter (DMT)-like permease
VATVLVLSGIAVLVGDGLQQGTWAGDLAGIVVSLSLSANFVVMRHRKDINMVPATALGALWSALAVAAGALALGHAPPVPIGAGDLPWMLAMGLVVVPGAFGLITIGPRYITAPEVGLLMLLETLLGPLWVWLVLNELPTPTAFAAGVFVVVTLIGYFTVRLKRQAAARYAAS